MVHEKAYQGQWIGPKGKRGGYCSGKRANHHGYYCSQTYRVGVVISKKERRPPIQKTDHGWNSKIDYQRPRKIELALLRVNGRTFGRWRQDSSQQRWPWTCKSRICWLCWPYQGKIETEGAEAKWVSDRKAAPKIQKSSDQGAKGRAVDFLWGLLPQIQ